MPGTRLISLSVGTRYLSELMRAERRIAAPHGQGDDGHVIDALGLDERLSNPDAGRPPVLVRIDGVVEAHDGVITVNSDFVLDGQDRQAGTRDGIDVFDAGNLPQYLFHRRRHEILDLFRACAREGNQNIRERHVDLRLFLARRHEHGEDPHQKRRQCQQRREPILEEESREPAAQAQRLIHLAACAGARRALAAIGSRAIRSPADKPERISTLSPNRCPGRT